MDKDDEPDLFGGRAARDEGMNRVEANSGEWKERARALIERIPSGFEGTGEAYKLECRKMGLEEPHHYNAWGPVIGWAAKRGLIRHTGEWKQCITKKRHAQMARVWRRA